MPTSKCTPIEQHLIEMRRIRLHGENVPFSVRCMVIFYQLITGCLTPLPGPIVELGSGIGAVKEFIPTCITTDIFPNPWLDQQPGWWIQSVSSSGGWLSVGKEIEILCRLQDACV
jgi:hypothetical protein